MELRSRPYNNSVFLLPSLRTALLRQAPQILPLWEALLRQSYPVRLPAVRFLLNQNKRLVRSHQHSKPDHFHQRNTDCHSHQHNRLDRSHQRNTEHRSNPCNKKMPIAFAPN